ncbi:MAG: SURF1 family protein [Actinophytocola sp.]|nr:SURF1 family protein [Actinophytocola sp.]
MRLKFLLRPNWVALTLVVFLFAIACFLLLSPWQWGRHTERDARNEAIERSLSQPPRPVEQVLPDGEAPSSDTEWARVEVTGTYLPDAELVARLRSVNGEPAYEVLTPLRTTSGDTVLVDRGYIQPDDQVGVPDYAPPPDGEVTVVARVRADESDPQGRSAFTPNGAGAPQVYAIDSSVVADETGLDLRSGYFLLTPDQPGVLNPVPLPRVDSGPFLSYSFQWIAFGIMALAGWLYFTVRESKPGGALRDRTQRPSDAAEPRAKKPRRKSVAEQLAEDEAAERPLPVPGRERD